MRWLALIIFLFLIPLVLADITFFDNPDGVFIASNVPATSTADSEVTGGAISGGCRYEWNCTNWSECLPSGKQTRNCTNIGTCSDIYKTPKIEQNCTYTTPESGEEETEEIIWKEIVNKIFICFIIVLIIGFVIFYLKKDYFKKLIKKFK